MKETLMELRPVQSQHQKSFYGKALVLERNGERILFSYGTPVAAIYGTGRVHRLWSKWSRTTGQHVYAFCGVGKREWDLLPVEQYQGNLSMFVAANPR